MVMLAKATKENKEEEEGCGLTVCEATEPGRGGGCPELVKQEKTKSFLRASVGGRTGMLMKQLSSDLT